MLNDVNISGFIRKKYPIETTGSGMTYMKFLAAVGRDVKVNGEKVFDMIPCVAWNKKASYLDSAGREGDLVNVHGRMQMMEWPGENQQRLGINASNVWPYEIKHRRRSRESHQVPLTEISVPVTAEGADDQTDGEDAGEESQ